MFTCFFEVTVSGCYNYMVQYNFQAPVMQLLSYNPMVLAKASYWILC
jgi:hypothetical protein